MRDCREEPRTIPKKRRIRPDDEEGGGAECLGKTMGFWLWLAFHGYFLVLLTMARGVKPKAAARGRGRGASTRRPTSRKAPLAPASPTLAKCASTPTSDSKKLKQLERRDTDDQVDRVIEQKLSSVPAHVIVGAVAKDGVTKVRDFIAAEIRTLRGTTKRLSTRFWSSFNDHFDIDVNASDILEEPPANEEIADELVEKISLAHADNPAERTCEGVERYLEFNTLSKREMYLLIKASQEGPTLSKAFSVKLRVNIVKYFARSHATNHVS